MANYDTSGVTTDCYANSATRMPVQRWTCVEWRFAVATNELELWIDGNEVNEVNDVHVVGRGEGCLADDLGGQWLAPPAFTALHLGWESYQTSTNDRNLWVDDVALGASRVGCPTR
jgi:hypothetical protein